MADKPQMDQVSVNEALDGVIDTAQGFKNYLKGMLNAAVKGGAGAAVDITDDINDLLDKVIDKLQKAKG